MAVVLCIRTTAFISRKSKTASGSLKGVRVGSLLFITARGGPYTDLDYTHKGWPADARFASGTGFSLWASALKSKT